MSAMTVDAPNVAAGDVIDARKTGRPGLPDYLPLENLAVAMAAQKAAIKPDQTASELNSARQSWTKQTSCSSSGSSSSATRCLPRAMARRCSAASSRRRCRPRLRTLCTRCCGSGSRWLWARRTRPPTRWSSRSSFAERTAAQREATVSKFRAGQVLPGRRLDADWMLKLKLMARTRPAARARGGAHCAQADRTAPAAAAPDDSEVADEGEAGRGHGHGSTWRTGSARGRAHRSVAQ